MDDKLEKYIKKHRKELDVKHPRADLWSDIESQLKDDSNQRAISRPVMYWRAAAVLLLLVTSWLVIEKFTVKPQEISQASIEEINPELAEAETFYITMINEKREEIRELGEKYEVGKDFMRDIEQLDKMYGKLKQDLNSGNESNLVDAMIRNLQLRIEILNQQLQIIQSIEKSQKDDKISL